MSEKKNIQITGFVFVRFEDWPTKGNDVFLTEAVITCTHNLCFEQKYGNSQKKSNENCHFYTREKSLHVAWACFRNVCQRSVNMTCLLK